MNKDTYPVGAVISPVDNDPDKVKVVSAIVVVVVPRSYVIDGTPLPPPWLAKLVNWACKLLDISINLSALAE